MADSDITDPRDLLNKLSQALIQVSRGDPLVALRNELQTQFSSIDTRFQAIDKATELQHEDAVRVPTQIDKAIGGLRDLLEQAMKTNLATVLGELHKHIAETQEKFIGVGSQFTERDTRTDQRAGDTKLAVDAAFAAAKEATAKIEAGFTKQIDSMIGMVDTKTANLGGSIGDIKDRLTAIESRTGVTDPMTMEALRELTAVRLNQSSNVGHTQGLSSAGALLLGGCVVLSILISVAGLLFTIVRHV